MKKKLVLLTIAVSLAGSAQARATVLPDACGDDKIKFDVKTEKDQPAPAVPDASKAQIIFIENNDKMVSPFSYATIRYGVDGAWVGANNGDSYFPLTVDPGIHHLCVSWQSAVGRAKKKIDVAAFTAEPGKVYYFAASVLISGGGGGGYVAPTTGPNGAMSGGGMVRGAPVDIAFNLSQLSEDEGKYRVKAWKFSTWKSKQ
jgi:hypothetical protein